MIGIFIPYRNRYEHLNILLEKLEKYNKIDIHILEQTNNHLFNRGKLFNIGAKEYLNKYNYFIFHDVDLIPQDEDYNINFNVPTHLSCFCEQFNYNLFDVDQSNNYLESKMFGGVIGISKKDLIKINGYSNLYEGWGCEDNDLFNRIQLVIKKYNRKPWNYKSLDHISSYENDINPNLYNNLNYLTNTSSSVSTSTSLDYSKDGLSTLIQIDNNLDFTSHLEYTIETKFIDKRVYHHNINFDCFYKKKDIITIYLNELSQQQIQSTIKYAFNDKKSVLITSSTLSIPDDLKYFYNKTESYILKTYKQIDSTNKLVKINSWLSSLDENTNIFLIDDTISFLISYRDLETVIYNNYNYLSINYKEQDIKELLKFDKFVKKSNTFFELKYRTPLISKIKQENEDIINIRTKYNFNYYIYYVLNDDLQKIIGLFEKKLTDHFISRGIFENRLVNFSLPLNFNHTNYYHLNPDLRFLGLNELLLSKHYILNGKNESREYIIESKYTIENIDWKYFRFLYNFEYNSDINIINYWLDNKNTLQTPLLKYNINKIKLYPNLENKILILTHSGGGGVEKYLDFLKKQYTNNIVLRPNCDKFNIYQLEIDNIKYFFEDQIDDIISVITKYQITKIIINHTTIFMPQFLQICIEFKKIYKCPIILILHDFSFISFNSNISMLDIEDIHNRIYNPYYIARCQLLEYIDKIISPSNFIKNKFMQTTNTIVPIYKLYHPDISIGEINKNIITNCLNLIFKILVIGDNKGNQEIIDFEKVMNNQTELIYIGKNNINSNKIKIYSNSYSDDNIHTIINEIKPNIFWFPSKIPETYCYALSHPIKLGYPIITYNIGSFSERLSGRKMTWLMNINENISDYIDKIVLEYKDEFINNKEYVDEYEKKIINDIDYFKYFEPL
jgi:hypothetical protein